jgi:hypothetical protein
MGLATHWHSFWLKWAIIHLQKLKRDPTITYSEYISFEKEFSKFSSLNPSSNKE